MLLDRKDIERRLIDVRASSQLPADAVYVSVENGPNCGTHKLTESINYLTYARVDYVMLL